MATRKKVDRGASSPPVSEAEDMIESPVKMDRVVIGDIVLYAHRTMSADPSFAQYFYLPMIVTAVHDGNAVDGMVVSSMPEKVGYGGTKFVNGIEFGDGVDQWRHRA